AIWEKLEKMGRKPAVDLTDPDKEFFIEVRDNKAYIFTEKIKGVAGLPLGTQGKMVALVSGGIDSPVSAWMMMRRGVEIIPVYFDNDPYADSSTLNRAIECINVLQSWAPNYPMKTYSVPHGESLGSFIQHCGKKNTCVLCKRTMYRVSYEIMKKENAQGIITGSSLGQVASQTAANMHAEIYGLGIPLYHPLIGLDKNDIIDLARNIGTYRPSTSKATCCSAVPVHPEVNAKYDSLVYEEEMAGIEELVEKAVKNTKIISLS
ncbi:tRNA sulfurtransferase, partial [Methanosalsum natronophilum]|uniref:tRNA sulfurtransferase n=1 Tax=Methanosalsum natronophilum TaxID=768733 RepID=UPI002168DCCB